MRIFLIFFTLLTWGFAKSYMATIEPVHAYTIYAQAAGEIVKLDENDEKKVINKELIHIDSKIESLRMKSYKEQLKHYKEEEKIHQRLYDNSKNIRGKSKTEKDTLLLALLAQQTKVSELELKIAELQDTLDKKRIFIRGLYLKELYVNLHDYVSVGTKVAQVYDISKGKMTLYIHKDDIKEIKEKKIYIDGVESSAVISKLDMTLDETYVSSYKAELVTHDISFGKLVTIEFR